MNMTPRCLDPQWLRRVTGVLVPSLSATDDSTGGSAELAAFFGRSATDLGIDAVLADVVGGLAPHVRRAVERAFDRLPAEFCELDDVAATAAWSALSGDAETRFGAFVITSTVCAMNYTLPGPDGWNANWPVLQFAGPLLDPPSPEQFPKTLRRLDLPAVTGGESLRYDAIVVGSGAGGGVAAARLAAAGLSVLVLEKGTYRNEPDLPQYEALSFPNLYLDGGYVWSDNGTVACLAGATVGGGTTVNSMACMVPPAFVRAEWAAHGMSGAEGAEFDQHLESVMTRINARVENTKPNVVNRLLIRGLDELGLPYSMLARNAKDDDDRYCGSCNAGCLIGCKQSTMKTFLQDASDAGGDLLDRTTVRQVCVEDGAVRGVVAEVLDGDGAPVGIDIACDLVVLAAGALMTPLVLQASGLGGPRVGKNLHVHPSYFMSGVFDEPVRGWEGQILTTACQEFEQVSDGHGFVVEAAPMGLGFWTGLTAWHDGAQHKREQLRLPNVSGVWGFVRDHGAGEVRADEAGRPFITWDIDDAVDLEVVRRCHVELARILRAAGAREIFTFLPGDPRWHEGEDFDAFIEVLNGLEAADVFTLSAHQSGTCALGEDPATSVVDGHGRVHGVEGLWIADASALPTAPGVNPMISIEAFASRAAGYAAAAFRAGATSTVAAG